MRIRLLVLVASCAILSLGSTTYTSSTEQEAARVLSKHKALFTLIPQRVAQVLKVLRLQAHAPPAQRLELVHTTMTHVRDKYKVVEQLRTTVKGTRKQLAPYLSAGSIKKLKKFERRTKNYLATLNSTLGVLDDEAGKLVVVAQADSSYNAHSKAHQAAQAVLAPNHIDTLVDTLAGHDRATNTAPDNSVNRLSGEIKALRQQIATMRPTTVTPAVPQDFSRALAQMSTRHMAATKPAATVIDYDDAEPVLPVATPQKAPHTPITNIVDENMATELAGDARRVGSGLLMGYRLVKTGLGHAIRVPYYAYTGARYAHNRYKTYAKTRPGVKATPKAKAQADALARLVTVPAHKAYTAAKFGAGVVGRRIAKGVRTPQAALMSAAPVGGVLAGQGAWSLASKLRTQSLMDPMRVIDHPLLPAAIEKTYDDAVYASHQGLKRLARAAVKTAYDLKDITHKAGALVWTGVKAGAQYVRRAAEQVGWLLTFVGRSLAAGVRTTLGAAARATRATVHGAAAVAKVATQKTMTGAAATGRAAYTAGAYVGGATASVARTTGNVTVRGVGTAYNAAKVTGAATIGAAAATGKALAHGAHRVGAATWYGVKQTGSGVAHAARTTGNMTLRGLTTATQATGKAIGTGAHLGYYGITRAKDMAQQGGIVLGQKVYDAGNKAAQGIATAGSVVGKAGATVGAGVVFTAGAVATTGYGAGKGIVHGITVAAQSAWHAIVRVAQLAFHYAGLLADAVFAGVQKVWDEVCYTGGAIADTAVIAGRKVTYGAYAIGRVIGSTAQYAGQQAVAGAAATGRAAYTAGAYVGGATASAARTTGNVTVRGAGTAYNAAKATGAATIGAAAATGKALAHGAHRVGAATWYGVKQTGSGVAHAARTTGNMTLRGLTTATQATGKAIGTGAHLGYYGITRAKDMAQQSGIVLGQKVYDAGNKAAQGIATAGSVARKAGLTVGAGVVFTAGAVATTGYGAGKGIVHGVTMVAQSAWRTMVRGAQLAYYYAGLLADAVFAGVQKIWHEVCYTGGAIADTAVIAGRKVTYGAYTIGRGISSTAHSAGSVVAHRAQREAAGLVSGLKGIAQSIAIGFDTAGSLFMDMVRGIGNGIYAATQKFIHGLRRVATALRGGVYYAADSAKKVTFAAGRMAHTGVRCGVDMTGYCARSLTHGARQGVTAVTRGVGHAGSLAGQKFMQATRGTLAAGQAVGTGMRRIAAGATGATKKIAQTGLAAARRTIDTGKQVVGHAGQGAAVVGKTVGTRIKRELDGLADMSKNGLEVAANGFDTAGALAVSGAVGAGHLAQRGVQATGRVTMTLGQAIKDYIGAAFGLLRDAGNLIVSGMTQIKNMLSARLAQLGAATTGTARAAAVKAHRVGTTTIPHHLSRGWQATRKASGYFFGRVRHGAQRCARGVQDCAQRGLSGVKAAGPHIARVGQNIHTSSRDAMRTTARGFTIMGATIGQWFDRMMGHFANGWHYVMRLRN